MHTKDFPLPHPVPNQQYLCRLLGPPGKIVGTEKPAAERPGQRRDTSTEDLLPAGAETPDSPKLHLSSLLPAPDPGSPRPHFGSSTAGSVSDSRPGHRSYLGLGPLNPIRALTPPRTCLTPPEIKALPPRTRITPPHPSVYRLDPPPRTDSPRPEPLSRTWTPDPIFVLDSRPGSLTTFPVPHLRPGPPFPCPALPIKPLAPISDLLPYTAPDCHWLFHLYDRDPRP